MQQIKLLLLPGMDGTGKLFTSLLQILPNQISYEIVCLNNLKGNNPIQLAEEIAYQVRNEELIIFAESYSGIIAYELSRIPSLNIKHIIFAASFLSRPSQLSRFARLAPLFLIRKQLLTKKFISWLFFDKSGDVELVNQFLDALNYVSDSTLRARLKQIAKLSPPSEKIEAPCTYLQATQDRLVSKNAAAIFKQLCPTLTLKQLSGGHFIALSNPNECWDAINEVISLVK